jgi:prepilin-type N-terminal cleavage/methylation domain-containing protein
MSVRRNFKNGFTLVELLVTITIFVILTGVVLFNQSRFNSTILLTNLAYDTALTVRQAQTYGINIKEFNTGTTNSVGQFVPYGVHFQKGAKSFILFADLDGNGLYDGATTTCNSAPISPAKDGCVNKYNIQRGNYIVDLCEANVPDGTYVCLPGTTGTTSKNSLDLVFVRPNPDAHIRFDGSVGESVAGIATVIIGNPDGSTRKVRIRGNGLIEIAN